VSDSSSDKVEGITLSFDDSFQYIVKYGRIGPGGDDGSLSFRLPLHKETTHTEE
jgi:hypothetical protein